MKKRKRVLVGVIKRRQEELGTTHVWVEVSAEMLMDLIIEARDRGSLLHAIGENGFLRYVRITDRRYGAVVLKPESKLGGRSFVIRKEP